jgi:hypothetical protein
MRYLARWYRTHTHQCRKIFEEKKFKEARQRTKYVGFSSEKIVQILEGFSRKYHNFYAKISKKTKFRISANKAKCILISTLTMHHPTSS